MVLYTPAKGACFLVRLQHPAVSLNPVTATQAVSHLSLFSLVRMAPCSWLRSPHRVAVEPRSSSEGEGDASPLHTRLALKPALGVSTTPSTASLRLSLQSLAAVFDRSAEPSVRSSHDPSVRSHRSQPDAASPSPRPSPSPRLELGYFRSRETTRALDKAGGSVTPLVGSPSRSRSQSPRSSRSRSPSRSPSPSPSLTRCCARPHR